MRFNNRTDAGRQLATRLRNYAQLEDLLVLGLPRGGVVVAAAVADDFHVPLDVFVVRKVGVPGHEELAMGAVASGDVTVRNEEVIAHLGLNDNAFEEKANVQRQAVKRREELYRQGHAAQELSDHGVILVDDGLATGATMKAAVEAVRKARPRRLVVAVPVAALDTANEFRRMLDRDGEQFACLSEPAAFGGVGRWYVDFREVEDDEVQELLRSPSRRQPRATQNSPR